MHILSPEALIVKIASIADHGLRVEWFRSQLPSLTPETVESFHNQLTHLSITRDSSAQITLLAWLSARLQHEQWDQVPQQHTTRPDAEPVNSHSDLTPSPTNIHLINSNTGRVLTLGERKNLARRPSRKLIERALFDPHPDVVTELLRNPRLTEIDVARLCASPNAPSTVLARVFLSPRWALRSRVRFALTANPHTPERLSSSLVYLLSLTELRDLSGDVRLHRTTQESIKRCLSLLIP